MGIIPATPQRSLTSETNISYYLLIVGAYSKFPKLYSTERITNEEVMDKLDMFQARFGKIDEIGWWDLERISADSGTQFTSMELQDEISNQQCSSYVIRYRESVNERTS